MSLRARRVTRTYGVSAARWVWTTAPGIRQIGFPTKLPMTGLIKTALTTLQLNPEVADLTLIEATETCPRDDCLLVHALSTKCRMPAGFDEK